METEAVRVAGSRFVSEALPPSGPAFPGSRLRLPLALVADPFGHASAGRSLGPPEAWPECNLREKECPDAGSGSEGMAAKSGVGRA